MTRISRTSSKRRRATAIVEFALVMPLLLMLTMSIIQYGLIYNTAQTVTNLSRDTARFAAINALNTTPTGADSTSPNSVDPDVKVRDYLKKIGGNYGVRYEDLVVAITASSRQRGNPISVALTYDMRKRLFMPQSMKLFQRKDGTYMLEWNFFAPQYRVQTTMVIE